MIGGRAHDRGRVGPSELARLVTRGSQRHVMLAVGVAHRCWGCGRRLSVPLRRLSVQPPPPHTFICVLQALWPCILATMMTCLTFYAATQGSIVRGGNTRLMLQHAELPARKTARIKIGTNCMCIRRVTAYRLAFVAFGSWLNPNPDCTLMKRTAASPQVHIASERSRVCNSLQTQV